MGNPAQGGIREDKCVGSFVIGFDADGRHCGRATSPLQRGRGDHGSLAYRLEGCGSKQKTLSCRAWTTCRPSQEREFCLLPHTARPYTSDTWTPLPRSRGLVSWPMYR